MGSTLCAHTCVQELTAERASLNAKTKQAKKKRDTLAARFRELMIAAVTSDGKLGVVVRAVWSLTDKDGADEDRANKMESRAQETLGKMHELWAIKEGLHWTVGRERAAAYSLCIIKHVPGLVDAEAVCIWSVITGALSESEGMVSDVICDGSDGLPVEVFSDAGSPSGEGSFDQA